MPEETPSRRPAGLAIATGVFLLAALVVGDYLLTAPVRGGVRTFTLLLAAGNRGDLAAARQLCTPSYLARHPLELAEEGGLRGLPRSLDRNFSAWRQGSSVWLCPTPRVGPVFQLVPGTTGWLFEGLVGELLPGREFVPVDPELDQQ